MAMIGQPGGTVRRPRLPITDPDALRQIRAILVEEQILAESNDASEAAA
jgi:1-pyrroline-4-hydroxy-2-carboxylate deaminase